MTFGKIIENCEKTNKTENNTQKRKYRIEKQRNTNQIKNLE